MFGRGLFVYLRKIKVMESKTVKSGWALIGNILSLFMFFLIFWEGIKWFHKKFGIIGDIIVVAIIAYSLYCAPGNPGAHKFEQNHDKPMWENHWSNKNNK